jgi:hypothetical protein
VPALLFQLPGLLAEADFVSVGTNDLMQFLFAADRGTPELADRYDTLSAPVLELMERLVIACDEAGVPLSVCGEAAGRPLDALAFAAVGVTTLSMSGNPICRVSGRYYAIYGAPAPPGAAFASRSRPGRGSVTCRSDGRVEIRSAWLRRLHGCRLPGGAKRV